MSQLSALTSLCQETPGVALLLHLSTEGDLIKQSQIKTQLKLFNLNPPFVCQIQYLFPFVLKASNILQTFPSICRQQKQSG